MKKHLVIIDGHHLMYRAYWAIPRGMTNKKGEQTNAVFGVTSMLLNILKTEKPDALVFCFDAGEETFRHAEYDQYKEGRAETPDDFYVQIPRIRQLIDAFGFRSIEDKGYEADDYACAYARLAEKEGMRVSIISGDRDLLQIVTENIKVVVPHKGYQEPEYMGPGEVQKKYGITPAQVPSYKGLVGDSSDNLKGVHGIGPKAASALISEFGSITEIYKNLDKIKPSWRAKLEAGKDDAFFCERMATLVCDMPLTCTLKELAVDTCNSQRILETFAELGFVLLTRRFKTLITEDAYFLQHFTAVVEEPTQKAVTINDSQTQLSLL